MKTAENTQTWCKIAHDFNVAFALVVSPRGQHDALRTTGIEISTMPNPRRLKDIRALRRAIERARPKGVPKAQAETARSLLMSWLETAEVHKVPFAEVLKRIRNGGAARQIALAAVEAQVAAGQGIANDAACAKGCAFCCILKGTDGGTIGGDEARTLLAALSEFAGQPDGRDWHPEACAALDPETRLCRAYDARPLICRTYMSVDAAACEQVANGVPAEGTGVLGAQMIHMSLLALSRAALMGVGMVHTYSMAEIARSAVAGETAEAALKGARHGPSALADELKRQTDAASGPTRR